MNGDDDSILETDIMSHESLNAFMAYDEAMCQCHAICYCDPCDECGVKGPCEHE
jgi:hypothetical protein